MRITVTGATGLIGAGVVAALRERGDEVAVLSRRPGEARRMLDVEALGWQPEVEPAPVEALTGRDGVVHLAGEPIGRRWTRGRKQRIRSSRELGTAHLVEGLAQSEPRPRVLVSASGVGFYGARGSERLDEHAPAGSGFLPSVCEAWEAAAAGAAALGMRVAILRTGVLIDRADGALARMLPRFDSALAARSQAEISTSRGSPPADLVRLYLAALDDPGWSGPLNTTSPNPVTNRELASALGRALSRPAILPIPGLALRALYGEMASVVTTGQRVLPARALERGFEFRYPSIDEALAATLGSRG